MLIGPKENDNVQYYTMCVYHACLQAQDDQNNNASTSTNNGTLSGSKCVTYTGTICQKELLSLTKCYLGDASNNDYLNVVTTSQLGDASQALSSVDLIATPECVAEVRPFLCLYFFGVCDVATGLTYQPSVSQCKNLRDNICMQEWAIATSFGMDLPDCDVDFPIENVPCVEIGGGSGRLIVCTLLPHQCVAI